MNEYVQQLNSLYNFWNRILNTKFHKNLFSNYMMEHTRNFNITF